MMSLVRNLIFMGNIRLQVRNVKLSFAREPVRLKSNPAFTKDRYPFVRRGNFGQITEQDVEYFRQLLPHPSKVLTPADDDLDSYNIDWMKSARGCSQLVLRPSSTQELSEILKYCNSKNLAVVPQGGNTGLVAGGVPVFDEIILSTQVMNKIIHLDTAAGILTCEAGCILENLDNYLGDYNFVMPLDLGSKGSCHIGGNVSTNAGGIRLLRYGSLHGNVLGLEAVLANGDVLDCMSTLRKDNTGYDLKQMFIGSEGTLGVVTKVCILCPQKSSAINVAFLGLESFAKVVEVMKKARASVGEILSAFEFIDSEAMKSLVTHTHLTNPLQDCPFYVLMETSGSNAEHDEAKVMSFLENVLSEGHVIAGTTSSDTTKIKNVWKIRESITESITVTRYAFKFDISLNLEDFYTAVEMVRDHMRGDNAQVMGYGHVGDGNLHLNVAVPEYTDEIAQKLEFLYDWVASKNGSISAEHGLGFFKSKYIGHSKSRSAVRVMKDMKNLLDPKGILNPYKTLPQNW